MQISIIHEQNVWQNFVDKLNFNTFLHSQEWAEFYKSEGYKVWQLGLKEKEELISVAFVVKIEAKRGTFLLVPHGPQFDLKKFAGRNMEIMMKWKNYLADLSRQENCSFIRIQPILLKNRENQLLFDYLGFKYAPIHMHTELSSVLDIQPDNQTLLLNMRKTTRQLIKKGDKLIESGQVIIETPQQITTEMQEIYESTASRGGFVPYSKEYLKNEWQSFSRNNKSKMFIVRTEGKILSWGMVLISGKRAFYHQGANILNKNVPASYICQWQGIQFAKSRGCQSYDFWGVAPIDNPDHPWANISLFKRGFGGKDVELLHAQDLILSWKYWINWAIESYRARKRGFTE